MMQRVVSLIASSTEIVCALGCEERLVGRSHECDYPPSVKQLPVCTEPKFGVEGSSREIDERVKAVVLQDALSVYRAHAGGLKELQPDVIITQSQCEVCAVSLRDVEQAVCEWLDSRPQIVSLEPNALDDVFADIRRVPSALQVPERGEKLVTQMQKRMATIAERTRSAPSRRSVACIEWIDPLMAVGNWMPELVEIAGGVNLFGEVGKHAPWMT
jgi:iron complex transport system substrate-binding protein